MSKPLIGIISYRSGRDASKAKFSLNEVYVSALSNAGAIPLMIPLGLPEDSLSGLVERLDGVLFSGGGDIAPQRYRSRLHPKVAGVDQDRDRVEISLFGKVIERKLPFLGICRGLQLVNVALGGTLYEDLLEQRPGSLHHQAPNTWVRSRIIHFVSIDRKSRLFEIMQTLETGVNSHHHQGVRKPGKRLKITAIAPDGIIEALELQQYGFGLAVQWHPEWMQSDPAMRALFSAFVQAAGNTQKD